MLLDPLKVPRTTPGCISGRSGPTSWGYRRRRRASRRAVHDRLAAGKDSALRFRWDPLVVKPVGGAPGAGNEKRRKSLLQRRFQMVEMGGLEPPTPYMRSDSGPKDASTKKARKRRKAS